MPCLWHILLSPLSKKNAFFGLVVTGLLILLFIILSMLVPAAHAADVTVAWDPNPEPDVAGYKIYYGNQSGQLHRIRECGQHYKSRHFRAASRVDVLLCRRGL